MTKFCKKKLFLVFPLIFMFFLSSCNLTDKIVDNSENTIKTISSTREDKWIEDIDYLEETLPKNHKNLYHTISEENYKNQLNNLRNEVSNLEDYQIKCKSAQIIASIGDAHTALRLNYNKYNSVYLLGLYWFGEDIRVLDVDKNYESIIGKKLVSINGIEINEIVNKINTLISHENDQWVKYINVKYLAIPAVLKLFNIVDENTTETEFVFSDDEVNIEKINLKPEIFAENKIIHAKDLIVDKPLRLSRDNQNVYSQLYWYQYIPQDKILYFQYNSCIDKNVAKDYGYKDYKKYPNFKDFSNNLISEIENKDIDKLIIDLRTNTGGNSSLMTKLASRIGNIEKLKDKGKIYVLTGRKTFSSGVWACIDLQNKTNAIFVGEETGGNVNGYGDIKIITLPNSKLRISYSTKYFHLSDKYEAGFIPDMVVKQSIETYLDGKDDVYEEVKNLK